MIPEIICKCADMKIEPGTRNQDRIKEDSEQITEVR